MFKSKQIASLKALFNAICSFVEIQEWHQLKISILSPVTDNENLTVNLYYIHLMEKSSKIHFHYLSYFLFCLS